MKKLIPLMALALVILVGCAKEETTPTVADNQQVDESSVWVINTNSVNPTWEAVTLDELAINSTSATNRSNSAHTHGDFEHNDITVEWSGTENNGGIHGSAQFEQTVYFEFRPSPPGAPPRPQCIADPVDVSITMETECIAAEGNEAVYAGVITEAETEGWPSCRPNPYVVGNYFYLKVIDNGQGNNAPADQFNPIILIGSTNVCGTIGPGSGIFQILPDIDIQAPGSVKVNN